VERLFIAGEVDDTHIYHVLLEIMPRIIMNLGFLLANPDVKVPQKTDLEWDPYLSVPVPGSVSVSVSVPVPGSVSAHPPFTPLTHIPPTSLVPVLQDFVWMRLAAEC
jgi:hypothetical protein